MKRSTQGIGFTLSGTVLKKMKNGKERKIIKNIRELKRRIRRFLFDAFINGNTDYDGITDRIIEWVKELEGADTNV